MIENDQYGETATFLLNVVPIRSAARRRSRSQGTRDGAKDGQRHARERTPAGVQPVANGPFSPSQTG